MNTEDLLAFNQLLNRAFSMGIGVSVSFHDDGTCDLCTTSPAEGECFDVKTHSNGIAFECAMEKLEVLCPSA